MAYVEGYRYDFFLSYAHVDEGLPKGTLDEVGWVGKFYQQLNVELAQRLGRGDAYAPWKDSDDLRYHRELDRELSDTVVNTALLLVLLSPGYVKSDWCAQERKNFLTRLKDRGDAAVIIVEKEPVDDDDLPPELRNRPRFAFWSGEPPRKLGHPLPNPENPNHESFFIRVESLSRVIAEALDELKRPRNGVAEPPPSSSLEPDTSLAGKTVYLAQVTGDLEEERDEVRRFLEQRSGTVLPCARADYPQAAAEFRAAAETDIGAADVFVQLLSDRRGPRPPDVPQGYAKLQWEIAAQAAKPIPVLQWRSPSLKPAEGIDEHTRELLAEPTVRAESLLDFQRAVLKALQPPPPPVAPPIDGRSIRVFVNVDTSDRELAERVRGALKKTGVRVSLPASHADPTSIRLDRETNLQACNGLILIYGQSSNLWVREQIFTWWRVDPNGQISAMLLAGPPPDSKQAIEVDDDSLVTVDCSHAFDNAAALDSALGQFLERIRERKAAA